MKRMSASDVKNHWGNFVRTVVEDGEPVVVENRREPILIAISPADFEELEALRKEKRLQEMRATLRQIEERQAELNRDLTAEQADELVQRYIAEVRRERAQRAGTR